MVSIVINMKQKTSSALYLCVLNRKISDIYWLLYTWYLIVCMFSSCLPCCHQEPCNTLPLPGKLIASVCWLYQNISYVKPGNINQSLSALKDFGVTASKLLAFKILVGDGFTTIWYILSMLVKKQVLLWYGQCALFRKYSGHFLNIRVWE